MNRTKPVTAIHFEDVRCVKIGLQTALIMLNRVDLDYHDIWIAEDDLAEALKEIRKVLRKAGITKNDYERVK